MKLFILLLTLMTTLSLDGCMPQSAPASTPPPTPPDPNLEISPAPITELKVITAKSLPPQFSAQFQVGLRDTCTAFHDLTTSRSGNTVIINVTVQREKGKICGQIYTLIDKTVSMGNTFTSGQTYTVNVNDQTTTFSVP